MRPTTNFTLHAMLAAVLVAFAATSAAAAAVDAFIKFRGVQGQAGAGKEKWIEIQGWDWQAQAKVDSLTVKQGESARPAPGGEKGGTEDINIGVGELQNAGSTNKATPKLYESAAKGKVFKSPAPTGSMTFRGQLTGCAVGTSHRTATMVTRTYKYEFQDVVITSCGAAGSGGNQLPLEEISFNYGKIVTKAPTAADRAMWDLKKATK